MYCLWAKKIQFCLRVKCRFVCRHLISNIKTGIIVMRKSCNCIHEYFIPTGNTHNRHSICITIWRRSKCMPNWSVTSVEQNQWRIFKCYIYILILHDCSLTRIQHFFIMCAIIDNNFSGRYSRQNETGMICDDWLMVVGGVMMVAWHLCILAACTLLYGHCDAFNLTQSCKIKIHVHRLWKFFIALKEAISTQNRKKALFSQSHVQKQNWHKSCSQNFICNVDILSWFLFCFDTICLMFVSEHESYGR